MKFQNVHNIQLFVKDNQTGSETTVIEYLGFIGSPVCTVNMGDFKRIGGKMGEGHESFHSRWCAFVFFLKLFYHYLIQSIFSLI